jgi:hypothetical protein
MSGTLINPETVKVDQCKRKLGNGKAAKIDKRQWHGRAAISFS